MCRYVTRHKRTKIIIANVAQEVVQIIEEPKKYVVNLKKN